MSDAPTARALNGKPDYSPMNGSRAFSLPNKHIGSMEEDVLYHFALGTKSHDLKKMFSDVKYVCIGGSPKRMETFAHFMVKELGHHIPAGQQLVDIAKATDRYAMFKVGPVLSVSHGMGVPSVSIMLHEIIKLVHHAGCKDVEFFRIGTSGGLGLAPGTVVITGQALNGLMEPVFKLPILGKMNDFEAVLDASMASDLLVCHHHEDNFETVIGKTMCTDDFYEGQGRLDGAFCDFTENDKMDYLNDIHKQGVVNIEMESVCFAAMCHRAGIRGAVICVTLLDRLHGDQLTTPHDVMDNWQMRPQKVVARYIIKKMGLTVNGEQ